MRAVSAQLDSYPNPERRHFVWQYSLHSHLYYTLMPYRDKKTQMRLSGGGKYLVLRLCNLFHRTMVTKNIDHIDLTIISNANDEGIPHPRTDHIH